MQDANDTNVIVQSVVDSEKTFDACEFGMAVLEARSRLGLDKRILKATKDMGYEHPTLVQVGLFCRWLNL